MNVYGVIALVFAVILFAHVFDAVEPISLFIRNVVDIPVLLEEDYGDNPQVFKLAIRLAYLILILGVLKMLLSRNGDEE